MNSFPNAKRIVYSTCSLFPEENERVITNIVKASRTKWRVQDVKELLKDQWNNFGSGMYGSIGTRCLYAIPDSDFTIGFFLAVLDRDSKDLEKSHENEINGEVAENKQKNCKTKSKNKDGNVKEIETHNDGVAEEKNDRKKIKKEQASSTEESDKINIKSNDFEELNQKRKKKKKGKEVAEIDHIDVKTINTEVMCDEKTEINTEVPEKKEKRKRKQKSNIDDVGQESERPDDEANHNIGLGSPTNVIDSVERKKKKKKSKVKEKPLTDFSTDDKNNDISNNKIMIEVNTEEPPKKKKKKEKKRDLVENTESVKTNSETIEDFNKKSKKKKK